MGWQDRMYRYGVHRLVDIVRILLMSEDCYPKCLISIPGRSFLPWHCGRDSMTGLTRLEWRYIAVARLVRLAVTKGAAMTNASTRIPAPLFAGYSSLSAWRCLSRGRPVECPSRPPALHTSAALLDPPPCPSCRCPTAYGGSKKISLISDLLCSCIS